MEKKGQGALEYLLLIGGAVLIAVIVIAVITGLANTSGGNVSTAVNCAQLQGCTKCLNAALNTCASLKSDGSLNFMSAGVGTCTAAQNSAYIGCRPA